MTLLVQAKKVEDLSDLRCPRSALITSLVILAVQTLSAGEVSACRMYLLARVHLANHPSQPYDVGGLAILSYMDSGGDESAPWWRATFRVDSVFKGQPTNQMLTDYQFGGHGWCWRAPTPANGERWVVFLTQPDDAKGFAYPQ